MVKPVRIGMVVNSWDRPCGVGEYGRALVEAIRRLGQPVEAMAVTPAQAAARACAIRLDLVHFQYEYNLYDAGELCAGIAELARSGIESVVTVHSWAPEAEYANKLIRVLPRLITTLPALRLAWQRERIEASRVTVIPIGMHSYSMPPRGELRAAMGLGGEPAIGFFGFFHRHKGIENLGLAVRDLRRFRPGLRCFLFASEAPNEGSRRAHEQVRAFFDTHGLWEGVSVQEGYLPEEEVVRRLHAMDVNVLPYAELSGVQASAAARVVLAAQRPTVVTDTAHFSDLRVEVYKIQDNAPERIAAAVAHLLDHSEQARVLVENTRRLAERANWEQVAAAHLRYYATILSGIPGGRRPARA